MAATTTTSVNTSITRRGNAILVKTTTTTTTERPGQEKLIEMKERIVEYKGNDGYRRLPKEIKDQLEKRYANLRPFCRNATIGDFAKDCLIEHNKFRVYHGVPPLKLHPDLMAYSERKAKEFARLDASKITDVKYGTNISCLWSSDPGQTVKAKEIVTRWYEEGKNYVFTEEPIDLKAGHFTQLIWKNTQHFGISAAKSDSNRIYIVGSYSPSGNYKNEFRKNVFPPINILAKRKMKFYPSINVNMLNDEFVRYHNRCRDRHGVPLLKLSKQLQASAQGWAENLAKANLFEILEGPTEERNTSAEPHGGQGVLSTEISKGHELIGMGAAKTMNGQHVVVTFYNPPGNRKF